jgi:hypothetical protein
MSFKLGIEINVVNLLMATFRDILAKKQEAGNL